ncbi:hypothetical protein FKM82_022991 [Ascaphus truei]
MAESTLGVIHSISEEMDGTAPPCFTFGVIADIQYADKDDGYNYTQTSMRYYRNSLSLLRHAVEEWSRERIKPNCILQLGDLIDGFNVQYKTSETSLRKVLTEMAKLQIPFHHIWGNHEFYNFSRKYLTDSQLNTTPAADMADALPVTSTGSGLEEDPETFYAYHFSPFPKFRFLLIDSYDLSVIGRDPSSGKYEKSMKLLREKNPNEDLNSSTGLEERQFVQYNGGVGPAQLRWINSVLAFSDGKEEKATCLSTPTRQTPRAWPGITETSCPCYSPTDVWWVILQDTTIMGDTAWTPAGYTT